MAVKRAVRKRAASSTNADPDVRAAKKGRNAKAAESSVEKSTHNDSPDDIGESASEDGDDSSFEADEEEEDSSASDGVESTTSSFRDEPRPSSSRRASRNAPSRSHATPQKQSRASTGAADQDGSRKKQTAAGLEVRFKKPQARKAGSTPYMDETVHPNTFHFLGDLAANNQRDWLKANDPDYRASLADFHSFIEELSNKMIEIDDTIPELPLKDIVFRIYRDVRFSKDQTPYKTNFSAAWSRTGRKGSFAVYYFQIKPGGSMLAGGLWHPEAQIVAAIRRDIDEHPERLKGALQNPDFRKEFLGGVGGGEKAVEGFIAQNKESALKTKPKGYDGGHPDIALLRLRSFTVHRKLEDDEVLGSGALERVARLVGYLVPFITYLNSVVMPDDE